MKIAFLLINVMILCISCALGAAPTNICINLDPSSPKLSKESYLSEAKRLKAPATPTAVNVELLSSLFNKLEQADPSLRMATLVQLELISKDLPRDLELYWTQNLRQHLYKEPNVYIIGEILQSLSRREYPQMTSELEQLILCDRYEPLRQLAIDLATQSSEGWFLNTFKRLWQKHPMPSNRDKIYAFGMKMLERGADAHELLQTIGRAPTPEKIRSIYKSNRALLVETGVDRIGILRLIARLGGPESTAILKEEFEQEQDSLRRKTLAQLVLVSQLEPNKPFSTSDDSNCTPKEEIAAKRLPYVKEEIERLLQPANQKYFQLSLSTEIPLVTWAFQEWSSSLKNTHDRIEFWERVLIILPPTSKGLRVMPSQQLVFAHVSYAGHLMLTDKKTAKIEIAKAEALSKDIQWTSFFPSVLKDLRRWIDRKLEPASVNIRDLIGSYSRNFAFESHTLTLKEGESFEFEGQGDAIDLCTGGRWNRKGEFLIQGRHLLLMPGPDISRHGVDAPDVLTPVFGDHQLFLLNDSSDEMLEFCNIVNSGETRYLQSWRDMFYSKNVDWHSEEKTNLTGGLALPEEWKDCILKNSLEPEVINLEEKSVLVVNMGAQDGLRAGMKLYLKEPKKIQEKAIWKISDVTAKQARVSPYGITPEIEVGEKLSTRPPD